MNKKLMALLLTTLMVFFVGCNSENPNNEIDPSTTVQTDASVETEPETIPGVTQSDLDDGNIDDSIFATTNTEPAQDHAEPPTEASAPSSESTEETDPSVESTEATEPPTEATIPDLSITDYEAYEAMSADEQMAFIESFDTYEDFVAWYNAAKAEYDAQHPDIDIGDGNIDAGDIIGGGN